MKNETDPGIINSISRISLVVIFLLASCVGKKCNEFLTESDIYYLKNEFKNRYESVFERKKLCSFINYFDVIKEESNYYDSFYSDHYFKYSGIAYYDLSICIVKNKKGKVFLFTDSFVEDFIEFSNNNVGLIPEVDFEDFNNNPEFIEFNDFLSSIEEAKPGFFYIEMLMKCFQNKGGYGVQYPVFQGPLYQPELGDWWRTHLNSEQKIDDQYDYFSVGDLALARIIKKENRINIDFIRKVFPNEYTIMGLDVGPELNDECEGE